MIAPGYVVAGLLVLVLLVLGTRLAVEHATPGRNYVLIGLGAFAAFCTVTRIVDVLGHVHTTRWSAALGTLGLLVYLCADPAIASRLGQIWRGVTGLGRMYDGPERRRSRW